MPEIRLGRSYKPDILASMHKSTGKGEYVDLGKQFAEGYAQSSYTTASSHVYTCMNGEVACSLDMFTLMRNKGSSINCYEYTVTLTIDDRPAGRMTASADEIRRCNNYIVTPSRTLYEDQGTFTIRVKEKQIKPIYHEDEELTTTNFRIDYMYFMRPLVKLEERGPLNGRPYDHIPALSWRLWDREDEV